MLIKHEVESTLFNQFRHSWLKIAMADTFVYLLSRTDDMLEVPAEFEGHPELLEPLRKIIVSTPQGEDISVEPSYTTRYLYYRVSGESDEGTLHVTKNPSTVLGELDVRVTHEGLLVELHEKLWKTEEYLLTDPVQWLMRLIPIDEQTIDLILGNAKLYHARCSISLVNFAYGGARLVPLGLLASLFREGKAVFTCRACGEKVFTILIGRGLSGGGRTGVCGTCGLVQSDHNAGSFPDVWTRAKDLPKPPVRPYRIDTAIEVIKRELGRILRSAT